MDSDEIQDAQIAALDLFDLGSSEFIKLTSSYAGAAWWLSTWHLQVAKQEERQEKMAI